MIEKELRPLRPPGISADPWRGPADAPEPALHAEDEGDSLLEPGALRDRFAHARKAAGRPSRWLADIVGHAPEPPAAAGPQYPVEAALEVTPVHEVATAHKFMPPPVEPANDYRLRDREQEVERRTVELRLRTQRLDQREEEVLRREEAAARWFTDLSRAKKRLDEEKDRFREPALESGGSLRARPAEWLAPVDDGWNDPGRLPPEPVE